MKKILIKNISHHCGFTDPVKTPFSIFIDENGKIAKHPENDVVSGCDIIDASNLWVSPGWIDIHTHIYKGVCDWGLDPDLFGPARGVTTMVDAGSSGHITFPGFRDSIIRQRDYEIYAFLNYGSAGFIRTNVIGDYETDDFIQPEETLNCIEENRDYIKGLKLRACKIILKDRRGIELVKAATDLAQQARVPLMIHIGEPGPELPDILNVLHAGDIVTHTYHGKPRGILFPQNGQVLKEAYAARDRGVLFDVGHGYGSFNCNVAQKAISQGFKPDLIGTDLHGLSYPFPVGSLAITMSKVISCGLEVEEAIRKVTQKPVEVLKLDQKRLSLKPGTKSCLTLFRVEEKEVTYFDSMMNPVNTRIQILPVMTIIGLNGVIFSGNEFPFSSGHTQTRP